MDCVSCKINKICPQTMPYGGYLCISGHMQCDQCNVRHRGSCGLCGNVNDFVLIILKANFTNVADVSKMNSPANGPVVNPSANKEDYVFIHKQTMNSSPGQIAQLHLGASFAATEYYAAHPFWDLAAPTAELNLTDDSMIQVSSFDDSDGSLKRQSAEQYLRTRQKLSPQDFPNYDQTNWHSKASVQSAPAQMQSVHSERELRKKYGKRTHVQASRTGNEPTKNVTDIGKHAVAGLDLCWQKLQRTYYEDLSEMEHLASKMNLEEDKCQRFATPSAGQTTQSIEAVGQEVQNLSREISISHANEIARHLSVRRAVYVPVEGMSRSLTVSASDPGVQDSPPVQFETVTCCESVLQFLKTKLDPRTPSAADEVAPLQCPETACSSLFFMSDIKKHYSMDHSQLPKESIKSLTVKNLVLNPRYNYGKNNYCHKLYLMKERIECRPSLHLNKYLLPILVMSSRVSVSKRFGTLKWHKSAKTPAHYLVIWVTGIAPPNSSTTVTLAVWSRSSITPPCHMVYSGELYSIRNSQKTMDVVDSGRMLMISAREIGALTNKCTEMLNLQLMIK